MTILPAFPRRAWLRSFLLVAVAAVTVVVAAGAMLVSAAAVVAFIPIVGVAVVGWQRPSMLRFPYRIWNGMAVRMERLMRVSVTFAAYYAVIVPLGWTRTAMVLDRPAVGQSLWEPYPTSDRVAYFHPYPVTVDTSHGTRWVAQYVKWARSSSNTWTVGLLPFLWLLSKVDVKQTQADIPTDIYTLA